ncbi:MAG: type II toxin-antitoxin system VapC family toxin [Acidobacteria bacterium]|nr:type II toxin-antitoxin system VapC family toxin [Acidobacteriota bacterium]
MAGIIFDSTVYINLLRSNEFAELSQFRTGDETSGISTPLYLSSVVLEELYVGAVDQNVKKLIAGLEKSFGKINRLVTPTRDDWSVSGQVLCGIGQKHGFESVRLARMTNDCLIAMSALRNGLTVVTHNAKDFRTIASFRRFNFVEI